MHDGMHNQSWMMLGLAWALAVIGGPLSPLDWLAPTTMIAHMLGQHVLLISTGMLTAVAVKGIPHLRWTRKAVVWWPLGTSGLAFALIFLWHIPALFALTTVNEVAHVMMHTSYLTVGFGLAIALPALRPFTRALLVIVVDGGMTVLALCMLTGAVQYRGYPPADVATAGIGMLVGMQFIWLVLPFGHSVGQRTNDLKAAPQHPPSPDPMHNRYSEHIVEG